MATPEYNKAYYKKHAEELKAAALRYYTKNTEKAKGIARKRYAEKREEIKEKMREYDVLHKEDSSNRKQSRRAENPAKYLLQMKRGNKGIWEFSIDESDLLPLPKRCPVLGIELNYTVRTGGPEDNSPSIDRFNNSLGYVRGNVRVISNRANRLKSDGTAEEHEAVFLYMKGENARAEAVDYI
jgi:hypothetical protein